MDQFIACLAKACITMSGISTLYTDNMPASFAVPSLYFPPFESDLSGSALNNYQTDYSVYVKVFAHTRQEAMELAEDIVQGIMRLKCCLPVYNADGTESGEVLKTSPPAARVIDEGVAQITLRYRIIRKFAETEVPLVKNFGINKYYD